MCVIYPLVLIQGVTAPFNFFNQLKLHIFKYQELGKIFICGDFNARCGSKNNDTSTDRSLCDNTINSQGLAFMEFLEDIDYCMLNGRFGLESNKYTPLLHRGSAVVDYCVTSTSNIMLVQSFKINLVHDFLDKCHIPVDGNIPA